MKEHFLPKSEWGPGPWQDEPDSLRFAHAGLECYIFRNIWVTGALNGYVAVPDDHPWWGKDYNHCVATPQCDPEIHKDALFARFEGEPWFRCDHRPDCLLDVHGGVTYSGPIAALAGDQSDHFTWGFGFDTAHCGDISPLMDATLRQLYLAKPGGEVEWAAHEQLFKTGPMAQTYKDLAYVRAEVERLAEQLALVRQTTNAGGSA